MNDPPIISANAMNPWFTVGLSAIAVAEAAPSAAPDGPESGAHYAIRVTAGTPRGQPPRAQPSPRTPAPRSRR